MKTTSPINRLLKWRREHRDECEARRIAGMNKSEKTAAQRRSALSMTEKQQATRNKMPKFTKNESHIAAKIWRLRDPNNRVHAFKNLANWIRLNPEMFLPEDIAWKGNNCRAHSGISSLSPYKKEPAGSWKGWTWYSQTERIHNEGSDLLDRKAKKKLLRAVLAK